MDSAFKSAPYSGYTTRELQQSFRRQENEETRDKMLAELVRRRRVAAGDMSVATDGEKLRAVREGKL